MGLSVIKEKTWYNEGLRFKCTGCGQCCTGSPGHVWVTPEEIGAMAKQLNLSIENFSEKYVRKVMNRFSLKEHPRTYDCVFLKDKKCTIYNVRPLQCRTYPWWISNLKSEEDWNEAGQVCEGINHPDAPLISFETIDTALNETF